MQIRDAFMRSLRVNHTDMRSPHRLAIYLHPFQLTRSRSAHDLVVDPLRSFCDVDVRAWEPNIVPPQEADVGYVFSQWLPSLEWLHANAARVAWLPMWDLQRIWRQRHWNALPKSLRVVSFSSAAAAHARQAGLRTLQLKFFQNPADFPPAETTQRILLYWNRTGLLSEAFLRKLCGVLRIDHLIFRDVIDPFVSQQAYFSLPERIGNTTVELLPIREDRSAYWTALHRSNVFIAPRAFEGAGNAFIEALAGGCAVLAHDAPTMNEYITHSVDGVLFRNAVPSGLSTIAARVKRRIQRSLIGVEPETVTGVIRLSMNQDWDTLSGLDLIQLGATARVRHLEGHRDWQNAQAKYAEFVIGN